MKVIALSDIHGFLPQLQPCDVVVICGDILPLKIQRNYEASLAWLAGPFQSWALNLDCKKVIFIAGNHDFVFETMANSHVHMMGDALTPRAVRNFDTDKICETIFQMDLNFKLVYLCDESCEFEGVKFYGTPWCPSLSNWAFYKDSKGLSEAFNKIPFDTDVLITHCPPKYGLQGTVLERNWNYMSDFGCVELQQVLDELFADRDMWVLSGHIHSGKHDIEKFNNIKYRNCSLKNEDYETEYLPFVFEITK
jgi:Icc-related predicted phosphoesterase